MSTANDAIDLDALLPLFDAVREGVLSRSDVARLEAALAGRPDRQDAYVAYMQMHTDLRWEVSGALALKPAARSSRSRGRLPRVAMWAIAAALAVGGATLALYLSRAEQVADDAPATVGPALAVVIDAAEAYWDSDPYSGGQDITAGPIDIASGTAEIEMHGGATLRLSGPLHATLVARDRIVLQRGRIEARVDGGGLAIDVPGDVRITDLGTAFEVDVDDNGRATVIVTEGRVRADRLITGAPAAAIVELAAGERSIVNADRFGGTVELLRDLQVVNHSFEADGAERVSDQMPSGWRSVIPGRAGSQDHVTNGNLTEGVEGRFVALVNYRLVEDSAVVSAMVQDTEHYVDPARVYRLTVSVGRRIDQDRNGTGPTRWEIALIDADSGDVLAQEAGETTRSGVMVDQTLSYTPSETDAGRRLAIRLANPADEAVDAKPGQTNFDNVRLVQIVPSIHANPDSPRGNETKETPK